MFIFSFIGFLHPLSDLQLLEPVLVHLPFSQNKPDYTRWKTNYPVRDHHILIIICTVTVRVSLSLPHCITEHCVLHVPRVSDYFHRVFGFPLRNILWSGILLSFLFLVVAVIHRVCGFCCVCLGAATVKSSVLEHTLLRSEAGQAFRVRRLCTELSAGNVLKTC